MINIGDLPHCRIVNGKRVWDEFGGLSQCVLEDLSRDTAHTCDNSNGALCHCCGKRPSVIAKKPGSQFAWCLECF